MRMRLLLFSLILITTNNLLHAQEKWDLRRCVDYALANNISIKQTDIQAKIAELQYKQNKMSQYPSLGFSGSASYNNGASQDPTTYSLVTQSYLSAGLQLQSSAQIFNWYSKQNTIIASRWQAEAAKASTDKLKNDIALTVANSYLQILLNKQQEKIALIQLQQSQAQFDNTKKLVEAGSLPELNATELESQVETDSANYITAKGNVEQSILALKAYMTIDAAIPFEIDEPPVELIPLEKIADLQPEAVYALALANQPLQRVNEFKLKAAQKNGDVAKAGMYPTISAFGSLSSNFINLGNKIYQPTGTYSNNALSPEVNISGTIYKVSNPDYVSISEPAIPFGTQLSNNFRQSVGLSISVPIFSGGSLKTNWETAKLNIKTAELQRDLDNQTLKQNIYQAYNAAIVALEKFNASEKAVEAAQRTYDFTEKRYSVGMIGTIELITNQNSLLSAKLQYVQNQFDYVFKIKVLEFYKGQGLKL